MQMRRNWQAGSAGGKAKKSYPPRAACWGPSDKLSRRVRQPQPLRTAPGDWQSLGSTLHPASRIPHPAPRIPHPAPRIPHPASHTPHPSPLHPAPRSRTPHPSSRTPRPSSRIPHPAPLHPAPLIPHPASCTPHPDPAPRIPHPSSRTPHPAPRTLHSAPRIPHPASRTPHPAPRTLHSAPRIPHPAPCTPHPAPRSSGRAAHGQRRGPGMERDSKVTPELPAHVAETRLAKGAHTAADLEPLCKFTRGYGKTNTEEPGESGGGG
ncbi:uncharacterized protein LOC134419135 [Melospiza melodia melodia]|uniref:uncharacterized protein LOC134419135 n=1 Tax=Melospiza melodia melodia TaxID=1914991 RepID=UPI002FD1ED33